MLVMEGQPPTRTMGFPPDGGTRTAELRIHCRDCQDGLPRSRYSDPGRPGLRCLP